VYSSGILTNFYNDTFKGQFTFVDSSDVPVSNSSSRFAGQLVIVILYLSSLSLLSLSLSLFSLVLRQVLLKDGVIVWL
jgi:hypothetical protein